MSNDFLGRFFRRKKKSKWLHWFNHLILGETGKYWQLLWWQRLPQGFFSPVNGDSMDAKLQFSSVQSLSRFRLFATPWIAARQASLSITNSRSSLRLVSIESVMPSSHLILDHLTTMKTILVWPGKQINRTIGPSQDIADSQPPNLWRWLYLEESLWKYKWGPQDEMFLDLRWTLTPMIGVLIKGEDT